MKVTELQAKIMYLALRRIAEEYQTPDELQKSSQDDFGLDYKEALEMSYENIQMEAAQAIRGIDA